MSTTLRATALTLAAALGLAAAGSAAADDGARSLRAPANPLYQQECASCHMAYPPGLLPAASWQRIMQNLSRHYGTDASLDAAPAQELSGWLATHAGNSRRARSAPPEDRITRSGWFVREHREVSRATWVMPAVKSAANCAACHSQADKGNFDEHAVRIPR